MPFPLADDPELDRTRELSSSMDIMVLCSSELGVIGQEFDWLAGCRGGWWLAVVGELAVEVGVVVSGDAKFVERLVFNCKNSPQNEFLEWFRLVFKSI